MRAFWLVGMGSVLLFLLAIFDPQSGLLAWHRLHSELITSGDRIADLAGENAGLRAEIAALESDAFAVERAIREDLGLALPGEIVVRFARERLNSGAGSP